MGGQFKDASAQNGCRAIHLLLEKTTGCQVPLNIHPSIRPSIHPSIYLSLYLSISLQDPPNRGGRRHQGASPFYNHSKIHYVIYVERERGKERKREREREGERGERERERESESESEQERYEHVPTLPVSLEPTSGQELLRCFLSIDLGYKVPACFGLISMGQSMGHSRPCHPGVTLNSMANR